MASSCFSELIAYERVALASSLDLRILLASIRACLLISLPLYSFALLQQWSDRLLIWRYINLMGRVGDGEGAVSGVLPVHAYGVSSVEGQSKRVSLEWIKTSWMTLRTDWLRADEEPESASDFWRRPEDWRTRCSSRCTQVTAAKFTRTSRWIDWRTSIAPFCNAFGIDRWSFWRNASCQIN